ncbi:SAF domain-containing protein [Actinotalea sp. K2]|uniref:SAF domain-containing protein n=1 Tax=Actinotalea sp. K2 TaxID=2939438 RepID=UPI002017C50F|nr:SAF domain-containing protein [Actinotalea sp. K2]MCL3862055.1 SAF domain-containing protein [Actinotalea sp. K2]
MIAPTRQRRRAGLIAAAVLLALLGAMAATTIGARLSDRQDVLVLARDVPFGAPITADDVTVTSVAVEPEIDVITAGSLGDVVGSVAAGDLRAGGLISSGMLRETAPPETGQVLVPIAVPAKRLPAGGLVAGSRLEVVDTPTSRATAEGGAPPTTPRAFTVEVVRLGEPDVNGVSMLDVVVEQGDGRGLAALVATEQFALVLLAEGSDR